MTPQSPEEGPPPRKTGAGPGRVGWVVANGPAVVALFAMALLREEPLFWRNAGGYPVLLREVVFWSFYPLLGIEVLLLGWLATTLCRGGRAMGRTFRPVCLLTGVEGLVVAAAVVVAVENNLVNWVEGRPLHWKPGTRGVRD